MGIVTSRDVYLMDTNEDFKNRKLSTVSSIPCSVNLLYEFKYKLRRRFVRSRL